MDSESTSIGEDRPPGVALDFVPLVSTPASAAPFRLAIPVRGLPRLLWGIVIGLVVVHVGLQSLRFSGVHIPWDLHLVFNVDEEPTVPTWYSSMSLLLASFLLFLIADQKKRAGAGHVFHWYLLAGGFAFMSLDEIAALHEMFNTFADVEWTIPGAILSVILLVVFIPFLKDLPPRIRNRFLFAGFIYLSGAVVVEHLTGPEFFPYDLESWQYVIASTIEETLEMSGVVLFVAAILQYMVTLSPGPVVEAAVEVDRRR